MAESLSSKGLDMTKSLPKAAYPKSEMLKGELAERNEHDNQFDLSVGSECYPSSPR